MRNNIIKAIFHGNTTVCKTAPVYQGDYGLVMQITHPDLPSVYEVHFANAPQGTATTQIGGADGVSVPDVYLTTGQNLYAWVFLHTGESDGETTLTITTPVIRKGAVSDQPAPPEQQSVITEAIAVLNHAVETTGQDVIDAGIAKTAAEAAQGKAEDAQAAAEVAQRLAESAKTGAEAAQEAAETARDRAEAATVHEPQIGDDGYWYVWDQNEEDYVKTDTKAQGEGSSDYSALSNKPKINNVELSGNKSLDDLGAASASDVAAKYTKPQTGIPKTDLASDVQTSLGKADTALQTAPVTSVNGQTGAVTIAVPAIDDTLTQTGEAADAKAVGDEIEELKSGLNAILVPGGETATLTNLENISNFASKNGGEGFQGRGISEGVLTLTKGSASIASPYVSSSEAYGTKKWICGFKYRITKLDQNVDDPIRIRVHLGSTSYDASPVWGEWISFSQTAELDLWRLRFAVTFSTSQAENSFKAELKEMYVYDGTGISADMCNYIMGQQETEYQDGTVTYGDIDYVPDTTLSVAGKAADAKSTGDKFNELENVFGNLTTELTATLADLNPLERPFGYGSWGYSSSSDGVYTYVPNNNSDTNVYCGNDNNGSGYGTGKHLVSFKYRLTKLDQQMQDPGSVRIILGTSSEGDSYTYTDWQYDTWTEFTKITDKDLTRVYFSVRGFATAPTASQVKLEIKEFYIYDVGSVDSRLIDTIIDAQNANYQTGTVTYSTTVISGKIANADIQYNVKNYGIKGDGATDDTAAIRTLLNKYRGRFYFPAGTYRITGTIELGDDSCIFGDGDQTVIDMHSCNDLTTCTFRGGDKIYPYILVTGSNTKLHDFKLIGNSTTHTARHAGVLMTDTENCFISNLTIYNINYYASQTEPNVSAYGICILRSYRAYIDHCHVEQCGYECIGIADSSHHCVVSNCITKNGWRTCIQVHRGAYDVDIIGNQMIQDAQAWDACFTLHGLQDENLVRNLRIENNTFKATVAPRTRSESYAAVVQLMSYCDGLWFVNNRVEAGDRDLAAESSVTHLTMMGNLFQCNETSDYRLRIVSANAIIIGNVLENTTGTTQTIPASAIVYGNIGIGDT